MPFYLDRTKLIKIGVSLESSGNLKEAAQAYASMLPYISSTQASLGTTPEYRFWTERLLARHCMLSSRHITANAHSRHYLLSSASSIDSSVTLAPFRTWAELSADRQSRNADLPTRNDGQDGISETRIWQAYYDALSILVQQGIVQPVFQSRTLQSMELKKVEAIYEAILLKDMKFPKANRANPDIETWVDQVMANWRAMRGPNWQQEDFGEGGKAALNRSVLDVCLSCIFEPSALVMVEVVDSNEEFIGPVSRSYPELSLDSSITKLVHRTLFNG